MKSSTMESAADAAARSTIVETPLHPSVATVKSGHRVIMESMSNRNRAAPVKVMNADAYHRRSPHHQR